MQAALVAPGDDAQISFARTLSDGERCACFAILEANMRQQYDTNQWGWDAAAKQSELAHDDARFVLVRGGDGSGSIQAFAHFRFDPDDEVHASRAVLYVRELQVAEPFRSSGLGARIMNLLQRVAGKFELDCVMLTVFKSNARALSFYMEKLEYSIDAGDPVNFSCDVCYHVLSRRCLVAEAEAAPR